MRKKGNLNFIYDELYWEELMQGGEKKDQDVLWSSPKF